MTTDMDLRVASVDMEEGDFVEVDPLQQQMLKTCRFENMFV
jgi:hypothetical protein